MTCKKLRMPATCCRVRIDHSAALLTKRQKLRHMTGRSKFSYIAVSILRLVAELKHFAGNQHLTALGCHQYFDAGAEGIGARIIGII